MKLQNGHFIENRKSEMLLEILLKILKKLKKNFSKVLNNWKFYEIF